MPVARPAHKEGTVIRVRFSDRRLRERKPPFDAAERDRKVIFDQTESRLQLRITERGAMAFYVTGRRSGSPDGLRIKLGDFPRMTVDEARIAARRALDLLAKGTTPKEAERLAREKDEEARRVATEEDRARAANTFGALAELYMADPVFKKKRRARDVELVIRRDFLGQQATRERANTEHDARQAAGWVDGSDRTWRNLPVAEITRDVILAHAFKIKRERGLFAARHALAAIHALFAWAQEQPENEGGITSSPAAGIKINKALGITKNDLGRKRVLTTNAEIRDVWDAAGESGPFGACVRMLMLTGQRLNDIARAKWAEVDLEEKALIVPAERYKTNVPHIVPLSSATLSILESLPNRGGYIFSTTNGAKPIAAYSKFKAALDERIAQRRKAARLEPMPPFVLHDLRRTVRTRLVGDCGVEAYIAERIIGHTLPGLHEVYDMGSHSTQKREGLERWARRLLEIVEPQSPRGSKRNNVRELPRKRAAAA